ncbi:MAG TPA: DCL family protein [Steroidobacteraceae bacterium]|jgi:hypothetical protein
MSRSLPVEIATQAFPTKTAATEFFKSMLNRYAPGQRVSAEDGLELAALLERHTEYASKVGCGVSHFEVMMTEHGTQCFRIVRTDSSGTDFSYVHCISQRPPTLKQEVSQAFRRVVRFDLYKARDEFFGSHKGTDGLIECASTGERIGREEAHMDHRPPMTFEVIVTTFLAGRGLSLADIALTTGSDNQVSPEVVDADLCEEFPMFHSRVARLDFVKTSVNLSQASRHRLKVSRVSIR